MPTLLVNAGDSPSASAASASELAADDTTRTTTSAVAVVEEHATTTVNNNNNNAAAAAAGSSQGSDGPMMKTGEEDAAADDEVNDGTKEECSANQTNDNAAAVESIEERGHNNNVEKDDKNDAAESKTKGNEIEDNSSKDKPCPTLSPRLRKDVIPEQQLAALNNAGASLNKQMNKEEEVITSKSIFSQIHNPNELIIDKKETSRGSEEESDKVSMIGTKETTTKTTNDRNNGKQKKGTKKMMQKKSEEEEEIAKAVSVVKNFAMMNKRRMPFPADKATKKAKTTKKAMRDSVGTNPQQQPGGATPPSSQGDDDFIRLSLQLPPPPRKIGLILQDDKQHFGLPILMRLAPDSPFVGVIPPHIIKNYWIVGMRDDVHGEAKITNSHCAMSELNARRRKEHNQDAVVEFLFAKRGMTQQQIQIQQFLAQRILSANITQKPDIVQGKLSVANNAKNGPSLLPKEVPKRNIPQPKSNKSQQKDDANNTTPTNHRDETIRRALTEFFTDGETRSLDQFCQEYYQLFSAISDEVTNNPNLCELLVKRKPGEAFSEQDRHAALHNINEMYSRNYSKVKKKRKKNEQQQLSDSDSMQQRNKANFPPIKPKANCKGLQLKAVEDFCANTNNGWEYLTEKARLSNFQGWRHRDCPFFAELDKFERCIKCKNMWGSNLRTRHPVVFQESVEEELLPKTCEIQRFILNRLEKLEPEAVSDDPQLTLAAKVMKLKGKSAIDLQKKFHGHKNLFLTCDDCDNHMLKQRKINTSTVCDKCVSARNNEKISKRRLEKNKEYRVAADSHIPLKCLGTEEIAQRFSNLKAKNKSLRGRLEKAEDKAKAKAEELAASSQASDRKQKQQSEQFRAPLLPWPFYLNYNPVVVQEYSMPTSQASAAVARSSAKSVPKSRIASKSSSPGMNVVEASKSSSPDKKTVKKSASGSVGVRPNNQQAEEAAVEDIAEEPLDYASAESLKEEEALSSPILDAGKAEMDDRDEFDGHLV